MSLLHSALFGELGDITIIQVRATIPAGGKLVLTFNPPAGKIFLPAGLRLGDVEYDKIKLTAVCDGGGKEGGYLLGAEWQNPIEPLPVTKAVFNSYVLILENQDAANDQSIGFSVVGVLMRKEDYKRIFEKYGIVPERII